MTTTTTLTHTPGPWTVRREKRTTLICDEHGNQVAAIRPVRRYGISGDDAANARLIAAAPDLLSALENLARHCRVLDIDDYFVDDAMEAVAKARG